MNGSGLQERLHRARLLLGDEVMHALAETRVILFGTGGVGSWCAEALVRSGVLHLTVVDFDTVSASNVNRQMMATARTIGQVKVEALRERLLEINPDAEIVAVRKTFSAEDAGAFSLGSYDYIIDAIDSLKDKAQLILSACETGATLFSSMGAALKTDPTRIAVAEFWNVRGCPLGAALRKMLRKSGRMPAKKFQCVYSEEVQHNRCQSEGEQANGSLMHITAIFGCTLAGLLIRDVAETSRGSDGTSVKF